MPEHNVGGPYEAVSVIDIAQRVYDIEPVKLVYHAVEVEQLSDVLHRVAYVEDKCVTEQALCGEAAVCEDIVAETALAEMQGQEVADIAAACQRTGVHISGAEKLYGRVYAALNNDRGGHFFSIAVYLYFFGNTVV